MTPDDIALVEIGSDYIVQRYAGEGRWEEATLSRRRALELRQMWSRHEREVQQFYEQCLGDVA